MRFNEKILLLGSEASYNAGLTLDSSHYIRSMDLGITFEDETLSDQVERGYEGAFEDIPFGEHVKITFKTHLFGSGTAGVAPPFAPLLLASRWSEIVVADTSVAYVLASDMGGSAAAEFRIGSNLHAIQGLRGKGDIVFEKGVPQIAWEMMGLWATPTHTADAMPTVDNSPWLGFETTGPGRTSGATLHGQAIRPYSLTLSPGNDPVYDESLVDAQVVFGSRDGNGKIQIEAPTLDQINFFTRASLRQHGALAIQHGQTAGNICAVNCPRVQVKKPTYTKLDNGNVGHDIDLKLLPDSGNDEISLMFT